VCKKSDDQFGVIGVTRFELIRSKFKKDFYWQNVIRVICNKIIKQAKFCLIGGFEFANIKRPTERVFQNRRLTKAKNIGIDFYLSHSIILLSINERILRLNFAFD